jgi:hypothetical protein
MPKFSRFLLAFVVLLFGFFCAWLPFADSQGTMSSIGPILALIIAVALAVGTYFLADWLGRTSSARQEKQALAVFSPAIPAGEALQMATYGYLGPGRTGTMLAFGALGDAIINAPRRRWYYVGLTYGHLILLQVKNKKPTGVQQVLSRSDVQQVVYSPGTFETKLVVTLPAEVMELKIEGYGWRERAKALDKIWRGEMAELSLATA